MVDFLLRRHRLVIALLCIVGGTRVALFSAAFPFWANADEIHHFDTIFRYFHGEMPRRLRPFSSGSSALTIVHNSWEWGQSPQQVGAPLPQPVWSFRGVTESARFERAQRKLTSQINTESTQPPFYYALAAAWLHLGDGASWSSLERLHWLRFLNALIVAALVWISFLTVQTLSESPTLRFGVPLLVAFFPQDVWYQMSNDALSPLCGALALLWILRLLRNPDAALLPALLAGACVGATLLTKLPNVTWLLPMGAAAFGLRHAPHRWARVGTLMGSALYRLASGWHGTEPAGTIGVIRLKRWLTWAGLSNPGRNGLLTLFGLHTVRGSCGVKASSRSGGGKTCGTARSWRRPSTISSSSGHRPCCACWRWAAFY